jgi:two-component system OmpR family sensor kinase
MMGRLLRLQWLALLFVGIAGGWLSFFLTWQSVNDAYNHTLEQVAQSVVRHGLTNEDDNLPDPEDNGQFVSQIWTQDGKLYFSSVEGGGPPRQAAGRHRLNWDNQLWQIYTLEEEGLTIQVSQPGRTRSEVFLSTASWLVGSLLLLTAGLFVLLWMAARWSLRPLEQLQMVLHRQGQTPTEAPDLSATAWPPELAPLVQTLDQLFHDVHAAREAQTQLVARAAHEFRTPLAALRLHVQLLDRQTDATQRQRHHQHLLEGIDRMTRLVNQLLQLAEFDALHQAEGHVWFEVEAWQQAQEPLWSALAQGHQVQLKWAIAPHLHWYGQTRALQAALDNLLHNAIRHSPTGSCVRITAQLDDGHAVLGILDHGKGLSEAQRQRLGQRFQGERHAPHENRSGLGLAIVRRVVELHQGELLLQDTEGGGLSAWLRWPQPRQSQDNSTKD